MRRSIPPGSKSGTPERFDREFVDSLQRETAVLSGRVARLELGRNLEYLARLTANLDLDWTCCCFHLDQFAVQSFPLQFPETDSKGGSFGED
jgi:hypothetical protein